MKIVNRVIVTGPMRSGTTMVADNILTELLHSRPKPEITPLSDLLAVTTRWRSGYEPKRFAAWLRDDSLSYDLEDSSLVKLMPPESNGSWSVGKDPELVRYPASLLRLVERNGIRLLLCMRDPLDVMASALEVQNRQRYEHTPRFYLERVWESYEGLLELLSGIVNPRQIHVVRYEDWVTDPSSGVQAVADWLEVPFSGVGNGYATSADPSDPYSTLLYGKSPTPMMIGSFRRRLPRHKWSYLARVFCGLRAKLSYPEIEFDKRLAALGALTFRK